MIKNTISVTAHIVTGSTNYILVDAAPKAAIEDYFLPDMRPPVQTIVIKARTNEGQLLTLSISNLTINARIE